MKKFVLIALLALLALPLALAGPVYADHCEDAQTVFGDDYTLSAGQTLNSNLVVLGGNALVEAGATVACSIVVLGGNVDIAGSVEEDVVVFGGNVDLQSTAVVKGRVATVGGSTAREEGAVVEGGESQGLGNFPFRTRAIDRFRFADPVLRLFGAMFNSVALGLLALLVVLFWPDQTARVSAAIANAPGASGGLGLLTLIAVPIILALVTIVTLLCLSPVTFIGFLIYLAALIFGWISLGMLVGARLSAALNLRNLSPAVSAAIGTALFTLVSGIIQIIPCVGWIAPVVLACIGLGAVTLTRFGTRPYLPNMPVQSAPPPPPAPTESGATMAS